MSPRSSPGGRRRGNFRERMVASRRWPQAPTCHTRPTDFLLRGHRRTNSAMIWTEGGEQMDRGAALPLQQPKKDGSVRVETGSLPSCPRVPGPYLLTLRQGGGAKLRLMGVSPRHRQLGARKLRVRGPHSHGPSYPHTRSAPKFSSIARGSRPTSRTGSVLVAACCPKC